jgi:tRNA-modifying protein YgfZ
MTDPVHQTTSADLLRQARAEGGAFRVPRKDLVRLTGADAFRYLNGQVTRDLSKASGSEALETCILTPKGKLCAVCLIWREGADVVMECDPDVTEALVTRLERYIVADDVAVATEVAPERIHLFGGVARHLMTGVGEWEGARICRRLGESGIDLPIMGDNAKVLIERGEILPEEIVEILRVERCLPRWGSELHAETLPPEAGLDRTHIDYDRGCYPGQEVISRLKSIGRVNRLLRVIRSSHKLLPGMILRPIDDPEKGECGRITSSVPLPMEGAWIGLSYVARDAEGDLGAYHAASDPLTQRGVPISIVTT